MWGPEHWSIVDYAYDAILGRIRIQKGAVELVERKIKIWTHLDLEILKQKTIEQMLREDMVLEKTMDMDSITPAVVK